jgi:NADPH:quinone reductase-like Zn-dependent oxidoreductase
MPAPHDDRVQRRFAADAPDPSFRHQRVVSADLDQSSRRRRGPQGRAGAAWGVLVVRPGPAHFSPLTDLCVAGDIGIHIDRTLALEEVPAALRYVGEGLARGKVVVAID